MSKKILVTYTSRTGWTVGVAEAIASTLTQSGFLVDTLPMADAKDLSAYDAVVAGSGINGAAWRPEAMQWMRDHQSELKRKPFAAFLVCMTLALKNGEQ